MKKPNLLYNLAAAVASAVLSRDLLALGNESSPEVEPGHDAAQEPDPVVTALANAITGTFDADQPGRVFLAYGDYPHNGGIIQRFDRESAETMASVRRGRHQSGGPLTWLANAFKVGWHRVSANDLPFYAGGHPESDPDADGSAFGWIKDIIPLENGAEFRVDFNSDGLDLIKKKKFRHFSPYWHSTPVPGEKSNIRRPVILESFTMTNRPRIPGAGLGNAAPAEPEGMDKEKPEGMEAETAEPTKEPDGITAHEQPEGEQAQPDETAMATISKALALPGTATLADIISKITALATTVAGYEATTAERVKAAVAEAETAKADAMQAQANAEGAAEALRINLAAAESAATVLKTDLQNGEAKRTELEALANALRTDLVTARLAGLQKEGRITPAQYDSTRDALLALDNAESLRTEFDRLSSLPVVIKTTAQHTAHLGHEGRVMALGNDSSVEAKRMAIRQAVENARASLPQYMSADYKERRAWEIARQQRPELFQQ